MERLVVLTVDYEVYLPKLRKEFPQFTFVSYVDPEEAPGDVLARAEIVVMQPRVSMLKQLRDAKWVHLVSAGVDAGGLLDVFEEKFGERTLLSNSVGTYGPPISEHLLALMLCWTRGIDHCLANQARGQWVGSADAVRGEIWRSTVAVVGLGDIGLALARTVKAMGARVLGYKLHETPLPDGVDEMFYGDDGLDAMLPQADFVCVCLPGSPYTTNLLDARRIALMKRGAFLANIGRGYIVESAAMLDALRSGQLGGVGLDVTDPEPLPDGDPLWSEPGVIITPHYGGSSPNWSLRNGANFIDNLRAYCDGKPLPTAVDRKWRY